MTLKVTIFGPVHAGKSTLAGYLQWLGASEEAEGEIARARSELGGAFDESQALAYLVDLSADERKRRPGGTLTTSKRLHITTARPSPASEIDVIDTPGGWRKHRDQRLRGLYYGDVGIYAIEPIADALGAARLGERPEARTEAFSALLTWVALRPEAPLIVAITKADIPANDAIAFERTRAFVEEVLGRRAKPIYVPISIDVRKRTDWNISSAGAPSKGLPVERPLVQVLEEISITHPPRLEEPVMLVTRRGKRPGRGAIYFGKVVAGSFQRGDRVRMAPVTTPHGEGFASLAAKASFLELSGSGATVQRLDAGDMGGIGLGSGSIRDVKEQESTLVTHERVPLAMGRYIVLTVNSPQRPIWFRIQAHVEIVWLGRYYQCKIYECEEIAGGFRVGALVQLPAGLAIPIRPVDGTMVLDEVLVSPVSDEVQFLQAKVVAIGNVVGVKISSEEDRALSISKMPSLRSAAVEDIFEGDENILEKVSFLLLERVHADRVAAPYVVLTEMVGEGDQDV